MVEVVGVRRLREVLYVVVCWGWGNAGRKMDMVVAREVKIGKFCGIRVRIPLGISRFASF